MEKNVGTVDRVIRIALAVIALVLYLTRAVTGTMALLVMAIAIILVLTSIISYCPLYRPFNINTKKKGK